jgi:type II secretory pathway pseudopilin PulG
MQISERRGVSLLVVTVAILLMATSLTVVIPRADLEVRRAREADLRFKLGEFRRAITKFVRCHGRQPVGLEELKQDADGNRFLRREYLDPITGSFDWQTGIDTEGNFFVHSASEQASIGGAAYNSFR